MSIIDAQARDLVVITPDNANLVNPTPVAIYVGGAGNLNVITEAEWNRRRVSSDSISTTIGLCTQRLITGCPAGFILNCRVMVVMASLTTATNLIGYLP